MTRVNVRILQPFNAWDEMDNVTLSLHPGQSARLSRNQAVEWARAGLVAIVDDPCPDPTPIQKQNGKRPIIRPDDDRSGVVALIVNYNMPERTDALVEAIRANVQTPVEIMVIDNGSDIQPPSQYTTLRLAQNVQTTNGWLMGLHYADALAVMRGKKWFAYWFIITSAEILPGTDPLSPMMDLLRRDPYAVGVHPSLTEDSTTAWDHLKEHNGRTRRTWMIDNIASLYRASWFDSIGRFDPALTYAWGIDLETCYRAREQGRGLWVSSAAPVRKITDIGYKMNRMNQSAEERRVKAGLQMAEVLADRYGSEWNTKLRQDYRDNLDAELVSVIVPTHNRPELLARALDSISAQTYPNIEAIVVNDAGEDVSDVVKDYAIARLFTHSENKGLPAARNTALEHASGVYIAYLDDDDWYYSTHIETLVNALKANKARAGYTDAHGIRREGERATYTSRDYDRSAMRAHNLTPVCCVMHERSLLDEVGNFDETLANHEDWDLWQRIADVTDFIHIKDITCAIDRTRPTMNSNREAMQAGFELVRQRYAK